MCTVIIFFLCTLSASASVSNSSINIRLTDLGTSLDNVEFRLYKVGDYNVELCCMGLYSMFSDTDITVQDLKYSSELDNAAKLLSGHSGLPSAKLFTDFDKLECGDKFTLHTLGKDLVYKVD